MYFQVSFFDFVNISCPSSIWSDDLHQISAFSLAAFDIGKTFCQLLMQQYKLNHYLLLFSEKSHLIRGEKIIFLERMTSNELTT